jgi:predicted signal transduction protein with EAL and GGDEF domain
VQGGTPQERVARVEAVRALIAARPIPADGHEVTITISGGIADLHEGRDKEAVYACADKALYLAKALGRNRVVHEREGLNHAWHGLVENGLGVQGVAPDEAELLQASGI